MPIGLIKRIKTFINGDMLHADTHLNPLQDAIVSLSVGYKSDHEDAADSAHTRVRFSAPNDVELIPDEANDNQFLVQNRDRVLVNADGPTLVGKAIHQAGQTRTTFQVGHIISSVDGFAFDANKSFAERLPMTSGMMLENLAPLVPWVLTTNGKLYCVPSDKQVSMAFPVPLSVGHRLDSISVAMDYTLDQGSDGGTMAILYDTSGAQSVELARAEVGISNLTGAPARGSVALFVQVPVYVAVSNTELQLVVSAGRIQGEISEVSIRSISRAWTVPAGTVITPK